MHAVRFALLVSCFAALLTSCTRDSRVTVTLESTPEALTRTLEAEGGFLPETFRRILLEFGERDESNARGRFVETLPGEFGGEGFHRRYASDLGQLVIYSERLAAQENPWKHVELIDRSVERAADLLLPWLAHEFAGVPKAVALLREHEAEFVESCKGLLLELSLAPPDDVPMLIAHALVARDLLELEDVPALYSDDAGGEAWLFEALRTFTARALDLDEQDAPSLQFLASEEACNDHWRVWLARGELRPVDDPPGLDSNPGDALGSLLELVDFPFFKDTERVRLELHVAQTPLWTNGQHDPETGLVSWPGVDLIDRFAPPFLRYAVWVEPDEARQGALLGERRLAGEDLAEYVLWFAALPEEARTRWTAALDRLVATPEFETLGATLAGLGDEFERGMELLEAAR